MNEQPYASTKVKAVIFWVSTAYDISKGSLDKIALLTCCHNESSLLQNVHCAVTDDRLAAVFRLQVHLSLQ